MEPNYIQENSKNSFEGKKPDKLCRVGCIVSIVCSSIILAYFVLIALLSLTIRVGAYSDLIGGARVMAIIIFLLIGSVQIAPIVLCTFVLKGKAESHIAAGVVSLIFSGLIGGILILVGKYENEKPQTMNNNQ